MGQNSRMQQVGEIEVMGKWSPLGGGLVWGCGQEKKVVRLQRGAEWEVGRMRGSEWWTGAGWGGGEMEQEEW